MHVNHGDQLQASFTARHNVYAHPRNSAADDGVDVNTSILYLKMHSQAIILGSSHSGAASACGDPGSSVQFLVSVQTA